MANSHDVQIGERAHTSFSAVGTFSAYDAEQDGVRHLLSIPAVSRALAAVIAQGAITQEMIPDLRDARRKAGMLWRTFVDLLLIALGPEKAFEGIAADLLSWQEPESRKKTAPVLPIEEPAVISPPIKAREERRSRGRKPKRFDVAYEDRERLTPFLKSREADVLALRSGERLTRGDTAARLGISAQVVYYIEGRILVKLALLNSGKEPEKSRTDGQKRVLLPQIGVSKETQNDTPAEMDAIFAAFERERIPALAEQEAEEESQHDAPYLSGLLQREDAKKQWPDQLKSTADLVDLCFAEAGQAPLLTREQEQALFQELEQARAQGDDARVRELTAQVVAANMRFAINVAFKYRYRGIDLLDLIQQGYMGLLRATEKYEWRRGFVFITYAFYWVRQRIVRAIENQSQTIRFPHHIHEELSRAGDAFQEFLKESGGREPTDEELATALEWDIGKVEETRLLFREQWTRSLDAPIRSHSSGNDPEDTEFGEIIADMSTPGPEDRVVAALMDKKVREVVATLPPREAEIICRRFGIGGGEPETFEEIGRHFGVSLQRVMQIEMQARVKLMERARSLRE